MSIYSQFTIPDRPDMLDDYLHRTESSVPNIRNGCEKRIIWNNGKTVQSDFAIVYIHGFSASRMETWPLCDHLAQALNANLFYTRLAGHGQDGAAMAEARVDDWLDDGREAMAIGRLLGRKIILVGTSTGGTLAAWLAARKTMAPMIHSLILLSPNFFPKNPMAALTLWPAGLRMLETVFGNWRCFTVADADHARYWTVKYPFRAIATMMQLVLLSWRINLSHATMPVLMMVNPWDRVISVTSAIARYLKFPSPRKKLVLFRGNRDPGRHVLAGDLLSPGSTQKVLDIILAYLKPNSI